MFSNSTPSGSAALAAATLLAGVAMAPVFAQTPVSPWGGQGDTVAWTVAAKSGAVRPGGRVILTLQGQVQDGWHVYALNQLPAGPTPLRVTLDDNDVAKADG